MKILHTVENYYPSKGGMQEVVRQLSERLSQKGHDVTVATRWHKERIVNQLNGIKIISFDISGNFVVGYKGNTSAYIDFVLNSDFDVIVNFAAQQWATDLLLPHLPSIKSKKVFVPTGYSELKNPLYSEFFNRLAIWQKAYDASVFLSYDYQDIQFARDNDISNLYVIPNGAASDEFLNESSLDIRLKLGITPRKKIVLHVGSYTTVKGHRETLKIFLKSYLKNTVLLLIGDNNEVFKEEFTHNFKYKFRALINWLLGNKVIITSLSREDTVAAYNQANVFLFPSNIECSPIVLFECMASKTPFLTTDVGNSKEIITWSEGGHLLPTTKDSAGFSHVNIMAAITELKNLIKDEASRRRLGNAGFAAWQKSFTWECISNRYEELYLSLLDNHVPRG